MVGVSGEEVQSVGDCCEVLEDERGLCGLLERISLDGLRRILHCALKYKFPNLVVGVIQSINALYFIEMLPLKEPRYLLFLGSRLTTIVGKLVRKEGEVDAPEYPLIVSARARKLAAPHAPDGYRKLHDTRAKRLPKIQ